MRLSVVFTLLALLTFAPVTARAQMAATLVADSVSVPAGGQSLIAQGNVEVFFDGTRLSASRIIYDRAADRLRIDGPIFITDPNGTIITADAASLDPRLENGILQGARLVLDQQLQLAANQIDRVEGRYTQLYQVAATSCHICETGETPLWEIRARRVVHDQEEQQLYFDNAQFRVGGLPIFYLPRMRLPDPSLRRATGLLPPKLASTDLLGFGVKLPYFIRLGDHRDLTLTPYLSARTTTLEAAYRQAFAYGDVRVNAAVSNDTLQNFMRGYVFADGVFDLGHDVVLRFDVEYSTDDAYLLQYGYSSKDRLDSEISVDRIRDRDMIQTSLTAYSSLRSGESSSELPPLLADVQWEQRTTPRWGGTLTLTSDIQAHYRETTTPATAAAANGRDAARLGFGAMWQNTHVTSYGLVMEGAAGADLDYYSVNGDSVFDDAFRATAFAETTLRYPLIRRTAQATHVVQPMVQLAWSGTEGDAIRNEDSTTAEFDQANLLALSRFAGEDAVETGLRGAIGLTWSRLGAGGWDSTLTVGRVFRATADTSFSATSGLRDEASDWLVAGQLQLPAGLDLHSRLLLDDSFNLNKTETRMGWSSTKLDLAAGHIFLPADLGEGRPSDISEWSIDTTYRFDNTWSLGFDAQFDIISDRPSRTGLQVGWQNECVSVDFSVSRRFTTSTTLSPSTDFGLTIGLAGFSAGRSAPRATHRCTQ